MRPVRRHEHRGCTRPLPTGNAQLFRPVQSRHHAVRFCAGSCSSKSSPIRATTDPMGIRNSLLCFLGIGRCASDSAQPQFSQQCRGDHCIPCLCGFRLFCRNDSELPQDCSLQSRGLSSPTLELGAHLHLQALRTLSYHSCIDIRERECFMTLYSLRLNWNRLEG